MNQKPRVGSVAFISVVAAIAVLGAAGQDSPQPAPRFQTGVNLVRLDVSVLDADRTPVRGLSAADFTILEDGKPQQVATFNAIDLPDVVAPMPGEAPWLRDVASDIRGNSDFSDRRVVVIVVDDATPVATSEVLFYPALMRKVIAGLAPDDLAAIVFTLNKGAGQDFTSDRSRLLAAVDRVNLPIPMATTTGGMAATREGQASTMVVRPAVFDRLDPSLAMNYSATLNTLRTAAEYLADLPDRRKALVFVSVGIPLDFGATGAVEVGGGAADASGVAQTLVTDLTECVRAAQRANVNIYAFDPGGLRAPFGVASANPANPGWLNREFLRTISERTGGFAVVDNNDPVPGITQLVRENGSYYLLGYVPDNPRAEGRFRKIEVRVGRPGASVRVRNGYYEGRPQKAARRSQSAATPTALASAATGIVPKTDLPLEISAAVFPVAGRREAAVGLTVGVRTYAPMRATRAVIEVDMAAAAYSPDGRRRAFRHQTVPATLNFPGFGKTVAFEVLSSFDLPPGRYQVRFAAETSVHGARASDSAPRVALIAPGEDTTPKSGSVYCDVEVPDFANEALALSSAALSVTPRLASGPPGALSAIVPVVPTTVRDFFTTDLVGGFLRVSQGGRHPLEPVTIHAGIMNDRGVYVQEQSEVVEAARFSPARLADYAFEVPVAKLAPGQYLLRISASAAARVARRDLRFTVMR